MNRLPSMKNTSTLSPVKWMALLSIVLLLAACGSDDPEKIAAKDREKIIEYIEKNNLDAIEHESGVFYLITKGGSSTFPTQNSTVRLNYTGKLLNGKEFDGQTNAQFNLQNTILGFRHGIPMFDKGSEGMLLVPSGLGYGPNGTFSIPPNAVLIFEIELIDFN